MRTLPELLHSLIDDYPNERRLQQCLELLRTSFMPKKDWRVVLESYTKENIKVADQLRDALIKYLDFSPRGAQLLMDCAPICIASECTNEEALQLWEALTMPGVKVRTEQTPS